MPIDQQKLIREHIFTGRGPAAELIGAMDQIATLEKNFASKISMIRWSALGVFLVLAVASVWLGGFFAFLGVVAAIGLLVYSGVVKGKSVVHDRVEYLRMLLKSLSEDAGQKGRFQVVLSLCPKREKISEVPNPRHKSGKQTLMKDSWLTCGARLSDGTSISESCTDFIRARSKKNARGKTKTKERRVCLLRIQLDFNPAFYGDVATAAKAIHAPFRLPDGSQMKAFVPTGKSLAIKTVVKTSPTSAALHAASQSTLLGAYRILNLARKHVLAAGGAK